MTNGALHRNRDFVLLQIGQLLSDTGTQSTVIAYPLLVLAVTHSPAKAGIVTFARALPSALLMLPAGLAADRWNRKALMIIADAVRVAAIGTLAILTVLGHTPLWAIAAVAAIEGTGAALFTSAQVGALRAVVPLAQLPAAAGTVTGRQAIVRLAGPPVGGALYAVARALPFVVDALSYVFSTASVLAIRAAFQETREPDTAPVRTRLAEGMRYLWRHPFLRACAFFFGLGNFIAPGVRLALIVIAQREGLSGGAIGALVAVFGACLLLGSLLSPVVRRVLPVRVILLLESWSWVAFSVFLLHPTAYVLLAGMIPPALVIPSTDSVVHGYLIAMTPDRLLGRVQSARSTISLLVAPLGPLLAGALLEVSARTTIAVFAGCALALALWGTLSPAIRAAPSLDEIGDAVMAQPAAEAG